MEFLSLFSKGHLLVGHRGHPAKELENTLESIESAIKSGADLVEVDIQRTRDGVLVLSHDEDLQRVYGLKVNIRESFWEDLRKVEKNGYRLASLEEALELVRGRVGMLLEIKNPQDTQAVLDLLERKKAKDWTEAVSKIPVAKSLTKPLLGI